MTNEKKDYKQILALRKFDTTKVPKQPHVAFTIQNKVIAQLNSYAVFTGSAKSGKSTYLMAAIASALLPSFQNNFGIKLHLPEERNRICYFDTESSEYDFYKNLEKIKFFNNGNSLPDILDCYNVREDDPKDIKAMIEEYLINTPQCSIIIVDGFLDLMFDYNDVYESRQLTNWFKKITKIFNICLIGVLHIGKGNSETLGHLGSNTDRWANSTLLVEKNKDTGQFILKPKFLRSDDEFDPIAIANRMGQWEQQTFIQEEFLNTKKTKK